MIKAKGGRLKKAAVIETGGNAANCVNTKGAAKCNKKGKKKAKLCRKTKGMKQCFATCSPFCQTATPPKNLRGS